MSRLIPRPKGLPSVHRMTVDQLRSEVMRLACNSDWHRDRSIELLDALKRVVRIADRKHDAFDIAHAAIKNAEGDK